MPSRRTSTLDGFTLNALPDIPDYRDRYYEPTLQPLASEVAPPEDTVILDQGQEGACTGFGLAAVVNLLHARQERDVQVSARMLYEMAKRHDEWPGTEYAGSSCRGAIKGWYHMGVCKDSLWKYRSEQPGNLTITRAKDARAQTLGAYYRIRKNIVDMHAAINEVGAVYASAEVHEGWRRSAARGGRIPLKARKTGGHAFAIVGYDDEGFHVQNSWGERWGNKGIALWTYEDWMENVRDAWVVQLALSTPGLYSRRSLSGGPAGGRAQGSRSTRRDEIAGHFVHVDDGRFHDHGKYWSNLDDVKETAELVAQSDKYEHLLFYAHGGLNSVKASAARIAAMRDTFKANGIYPYHVMYDTGLLEELKDVIFGKKGDADERAGGFFDWTDRIIERAARRPGRALWREMKQGARLAFKGRTSPGSQSLKAFLDALAKPGAKKKKIHLVGHSTGGILHSHLVEALEQLKKPIRLSSVSLMAPANTLEQFQETYLPRLGGKGFGIDEMHVYALNDRLERDDKVTVAYRKSLLYLVSRSFEEVIRPPTPLAGMQRHAKPLEKHDPKRLSFHYSNGIASPRDRTNSTTHGGFDNDPKTMNDVLKVVLGRKPGVEFTEETLDW
ncbi:MAG: C1 family peptidase [Acidobacteriota bacterium]